MNKLTDYQAIIVDLDGTLYAQKPVRRAMLRTMFFHLWRYRDFLIVKKYRELFERGLNEQDRFSRLPDGAPTIIREWMILRPLPYVAKYRDRELIALLEKAQSAGETVIVYSDYPVREKLEALAFSPNQAYSSEDTGSMKPEPAGLVRLLQAQEINPAYCLVIGDRADRDGPLAKNMGASSIILPSRAAERATLYRALDGSSENSDR